MKENFKQIEEAVMEVLRQLEEVVRSQDEKLRRLEGRLAYLNGRLGYGKACLPLDACQNAENVESPKTGTTEMPQVTEGVTRPTEEQVYEHMRTCMGRTLREDTARKLAREFLRYNDKRGWKNKDGEAIVEWGNCAKGWVRKKEGDRGESIYEREQANERPTLSMAKPKLFGDTFSQILRPTDER